MELLIKSSSAINSLITFLLIIAFQKFFPSAEESLAPVISGFLLGLLIYFLGRSKVKKLTEEVREKIDEAQKTGDDNTNTLLAVIGALPEGNQARDAAIDELTKTIRSKGEFFAHKKNDAIQSMEELNMVKKYVSDSEDRITASIANLNGKTNQEK